MTKQISTVWIVGGARFFLPEVGMLVGTSSPPVYRAIKNKLKNPEIINHADRHNIIRIIRWYWEANWKEKSNERTVLFIACFENRQ